MSNQWGWAATLIAGVIVFAVGVVAQEQRRGDEFQLCLTADIDVVGIKQGSCWPRSELVGLMTRTLTEAGGLELTGADDMATTIHVANCNDYLTRTRQGWYALTSRDMASEARFKEACGTVAALLRAQQPKYGYLNGSNGLAELSLLGEEILPELGEAGGRYTTAAGKPPRTLASLVAAGGCVIAASTKDELRLTYNGLDVVYRRLALADFDGDGFEDMLVSVAGRVSGGSEQMSDLIIVTRKTATGRMELTTLPGST